MSFATKQKTALKGGLSSDIVNRGCAINPVGAHAFAIGQYIQHILSSVLTSRECIRSHRDRDLPRTRGAQLHRAATVTAVVRHPEVTLDGFH